MIEYEGWKAHSVCRVRACRGWPGRGFRLVRDLPGDAESVGSGAVGTLGTHGDVEAARAGGCPVGQENCRSCGARAGGAAELSLAPGR